MLNKDTEPKSDKLGMVRGILSLLKENSKFLYRASYHNYTNERDCLFAATQSTVARLDEAMLAPLATICIVDLPDTSIRIDDSEAIYFNSVLRNIIRTYIRYQVAKELGISEYCSYY